ncbi:MAG: hypothetical protein AB1899_09045 [Pseudomonadota bacterium]
MKSLRTLLCLAAMALTACLANAADPAPAAAEGQEAFTLYRFSGPNETLKMLDEQLRKDPRFSELGCERTNQTSKGAPRYKCKQNDGRTYEFFMSNMQPTTQLKSSSGNCPAGCVFTRCPPNAGPWICCKVPNYIPCK